MNRRRSYNAFVRRARFSQGVVDRDRAIARLEVASRPIHDAMSLLEWRDIRRVPGATAYMVQIDRDDRSCPHPTCDTSISASLQHVFWDCPVAATAWQDHRARWRALGDNLDDGLQLTAFSLDLPDTPRKAWTTIRNTLGEIDDEHKYQDELYDASQLLWRLMALSTIHAIWCARYGRSLTERL